MKPRRGRPFVLDAAKGSEICALVANGGTLEDAARYVGCSCNTIRREMKRLPDFRERMRSSEMVAKLHLLRAMQKAAATHWRAAAWLLERAYPERFGRRSAPGLTVRQARDLLDEVLTCLHSELTEPFQYERIENRLHVTFEFAIRSACEVERNRDDVRWMLKLSEEKERQEDPLASLGIKTPTLADVAKLFSATRT